MMSLPSDNSDWKDDDYKHGVARKRHQRVLLAHIDNLVAAIVDWKQNHTNCSQKIRNGSINYFLGSFRKITYGSSWL